jgi:glycosyltransferase involved in cell wall biosynthesis
MPELSVIICSHNPRPYLRRVLEALREQTLAREHWKLLLVDYASKDLLASAFDIAWHPNGRHILEKELGLAPARRRGMREATADLFVFADDDNVLDRNYLSEVIPQNLNNWHN